MFRRPVATLFVVLWLALLGIEFSEDMGFINYDQPEMDRCVEAALTGLGEAIKISDDLQVAAPCSVVAGPVAYFPLPSGQEFSFELLRETGESVKPDIPIYRLQRVFLI